MNSNKVQKTVDNYTLEEMRYTNSDGSEIWLVSHKVSKKRQMMKKVGFSGYEAQRVTSRPSVMGKEELAYSNLLRQVDILKCLNGVSSPKCSKIIKTTNNYYLVYDLFPQMSLQAFLDRQQPTISQKLQVLIAIARQLSAFHHKGLVLLNLNINSIHVFDKDKIFIRDWGMARNIDDGDIPSCEQLGRRRQFLAQEVGKGKYSFASDIYSLGKLIGRMINRGEFEDSLPERQKLEEMVTKMTQLGPSVRPTVDSVVSSLQKISDTIRENDHLFRFNNNRYATEKHLSQLSLNSTQSGDQSPATQNVVFFTQKQFVKKDSSIKSFKIGELHKNSSKPELFKANLHSNGFNYTSQTSLLKKNSNASFGTEENSCLEFAKSVCRRRSLAFFILSLAEFVMESNIVLELAYILTKYARLSIISIMKDVEEKIQSEDSEDIKHLLVLLKKEQRSISANQLKLKKKFVYKELQAGVKCEFIDDKTISDPLLHSKVLEFAKKMIEVCDEEIINGNETFDIKENLLQTLFILKKIQFGSYERFWKAEETFFTDSKTKRPHKLSPRDILQKITNILKNNS